MDGRTNEPTDRRMIEWSKARWRDFRVIYNEEKVSFNDIECTPPPFLIILAGR